MPTGNIITCTQPVGLQDQIDILSGGTLSMAVESGGGPIGGIASNSQVQTNAGASGPAGTVGFTTPNVLATRGLYLVWATISVIFSAVGGETINLQVDGVTIASVSLSSATANQQLQASLYAVQQVAAGNHTWTIQAVGAGINGTLNAGQARIMLVELL